MFSRIVATKPWIMPRNYAMVKLMCPYNNRSPCQSTTPSAAVLNRIFIPYVRNRNIQSIGLGRPLNLVNVMNLSAISFTKSKWAGAINSASSLTQPSTSIKRVILSSLDRLAWNNTNILATVTTADNVGV
jgi:hypothetical protein